MVKGYFRIKYIFMKNGTKSSKKPILRDAHIYLPEDLFSHLENESEVENRSVTAQVRHILQERYSNI